MDSKIQLKHPQGKKAVSMDREKYDMLKPTMLKILRERKQATHTELTSAVTKEFKASGIQFNGSIQWHLEWVKLDLEARKIIKRVAGTSPQQYTLSK